MLHMHVYSNVAHVIQHSNISSVVPCVKQTRAYSHPFKSGTQVCQDARIAIVHQSSFPANALCSVASSESC